MISTILSALTVRDIRRKILFTAAILALYRLGAHLYVPGVNVAATEWLAQQGIVHLKKVGAFMREALRQHVPFKIVCEEDLRGGMLKDMTWAVGDALNMATGVRMTSSTKNASSMAAVA